MVFEYIRDLLSTQFKTDKDKITLDTDIIEELGADSLDLVDLIMNIEEKYNITVEDDAALGLKKVKDVVDYIEQRQM